MQMVANSTTGQHSALGHYMRELGLLEKDVSQWTDQDWMNAINAASGETKKKLKALYDQYIELQNAQEDFFNQWAEYVTGISFDGFTDSFMDAILEGKRTVSDFSMEMEDMFRNAIIQGFKTQYLMEALQPLYEYFAREAEGGFDEAEIARLQSYASGIFEEIGSAWDSWTEVLEGMGIDMLDSADSAEGLSGAIKGMSQESADLLAGQLGAMRINLADIAAVVTQGDEIAQVRDPALNVAVLNLNTNMQQMRDAAFTANGFLAQIASNTNQLSAIKQLLQGRNNTNFLDSRINGR